MPIDVYMVITDERGTVLPGESQIPVYDPYSKATVNRPVELLSFAGETEQTFVIGSQTSGGAGKIVFDPFVIDKSVDVISQTALIASATGVLWRSVDILVVKATGEPTSPARPYLSYRLGLVGVADIETTQDDEGVRERISLVFGTLQIGYQAQKADGSLTAFAPVGWDRTRNIKI